MTEAEGRLLPILLGEAPSRGGDRFRMLPLSGRPAMVLCRLAGIPPDADGSTWGRWTWALYDRFECRNLFYSYADATPWRVPAARGKAVEVASELAGRVVVCLGRRVHAAVCDALELGPPLGFHEWISATDATGVVAIPHPSGLNRLLNEEAERDRCGATLRLALEISAASARP